MKYEVFIGIDVSKKTLDVAIRTEQITDAIHCKFNNNQKGFVAILKWLKSNLMQTPDKWLVCQEHTGFYGLPVVCFFKKLSIDVCLEHPYQIKHSMGLQRVKTDKADAKVIARYAWLHKDELKPTVIASNAILRLQVMLSYRDRLVNAKKGFKTALTPIEEYTDKEVNGFVTKETKAFIKQLATKIRKVEQEIISLIKSDAELDKNFKLATSVKGVGTFIAAHIIIYTQNFTSIKCSRKFACYSGVAPFERSSGSSLHFKPKVSKMANKKMKALLNLGAWMALQRDRELKTYYDRKIQQGKHPLCAINAVRNKLLGRVFAVVNRGTPFVNLANY